MIALLLVVAAGAQFCNESPVPAPPASVGRPSHGALLGAVQLENDASVRVMPRQAERCLGWATPRLVLAIRDAAGAVLRAFPDSPPLAVGDLSRARGGPIRAYSRSHQSGRDADLAFFQLDDNRHPVAAEDLLRFDSSLRGTTPAGEKRLFDVARNWQLVRSLLTDPAIRVVWLFVSNPLRAALLSEARREREPGPLQERAAQVLHQPSDAPPHDDHLHLRIACAADELQCSG